MNLRTLQTIAGALVVGVLILTATIGAFAYARAVPASPALLAPLAGAAALAIPACVLAGIAIKASLLQQSRTAWLRGEHRDEQPGSPSATDAVTSFEEAYVRGTLIQMAAIEGFGLVGAVCALVTGQLLFLVSPMLAVLGLGLIFPTEAKFRATVKHLTRPPDERERRFIESQDADSR
ncbi:MAG: hypothetical protein ACIAS6_13275 [Phycisphaerales bacterium JB060]